MVIEATYKDGTTKVISDYKVEDGNNLKLGQTEVTISYGGKTVTQPITVTANLLTKIEITKAPNKTKYVVGQNFDKTGMIVTGEYEDGSTQEILDYTIENGTNLTKEQTSVTIKYEEMVATQSITVEEKTITKISVSKNPTKMTYIQNKEELDLTGGMLKIEYNDNSNEEIALTSDEIKVVGFDNKKVGKRDITYKDITVLLRSVTQIANIYEKEMVDKMPSPYGYESIEKWIEQDSQCQEAIKDANYLTYFLGYRRGKEGLIKSEIQFISDAGVKAIYAKI